MRKLLLSLVLALAGTLAVNAANKYDNPDTLFVASDGTAEFRNIDDALARKAMKFEPGQGIHGIPQGDIREERHLQGKTHRAVMAHQY